MNRVLPGSCAMVFAFIGVLRLIPLVDALAQEAGTGNRPASVLSKEQICAAVEANWARIEDLSVAFTFRAAKSRLPDLVTLMHDRIVVKGEKSYVDSERASEEKGQLQLSRREAAYDGERTTTNFPADGRAGVRNGRDDFVRVRDHAFFYTMMYSPQVESDDAVSRTSLVAVLKNERARVRPDQEEVTGQWCHIVDVYEPDADTLRLSVCIAPDWGFLPIKQLHYLDGRLFSEIVITNAAELEGLWFPAAATRKTNYAPRADEDDWGIEQVLQVDLQDDGKPSIAVNTAVTDEFFKLSQRLPPGTSVYDSEAKLSWTVGGGDYRTMVSGLETEAKSAEPPVPEQVSRANPPAVVPAAPREGISSSSPIVWVVVPSIIALSIAILYLFMYWRRHSG